MGTFVDGDQPGYSPSKVAGAAVRAGDPPNRSQVASYHRHATRFQGQQHGALPVAMSYFTIETSTSSTLVPPEMICLVIGVNHGHWV